MLVIGGVLGVLLVQVVKAEEPDDRLIRALIWVESTNVDHKTGDKFDRKGRPRPPSEWAYGPMQIRQPCVDDVNADYGTTYSSRQCQGNRKLSIWICKKYLAKYANQKYLGHKPTSEDMARIWNGGPNGWRSSLTREYWTRVQMALKQQR
jgi:hypothetical protein